MTDKLERTQPAPLNWSAPIRDQATIIRVVKNRAASERIKQIAARGVDIDRMAAMAVLAAKKVPALLNCTSESLFLSCLEAAKCGLDIDGVSGALVPFKSQAQFVPMYQGIVGALIADKVVRSVSSEVVYANDHFLVGYGTSRRIEHIPAPFRTDGGRTSDRGEMVAAYAVAELPDGSTTFKVMTGEEILKREQVSKTSSRSDSPWKQWPEEMWKKTALKNLNKLLGARVTRIRDIMAADDNAEMGRRPDEAWEARLKADSHKQLTGTLDRWDAADEDDPVGAALPPEDRGRDYDEDDDSYAARHRADAEAAAEESFRRIGRGDTSTGPRSQPNLINMPSRDPGVDGDR
jgi:phage RecT family recombinase